MLRIDRQIEILTSNRIGFAHSSTRSHIHAHLWNRIRLKSEPYCRIKDTETTRAEVQKTKKEGKDQRSILKNDRPLKVDDHFCIQEALRTDQNQ